MTYDFYADKADKISILEFIFNETDLSIFDLASLYEEEICQYKRVVDIESKFDLANSLNGQGIHFQLWSPRHRGEVLFRKIELDPKRCNGKTFRYATEGLGLIQLYFFGQSNNELLSSHLGHFNERGAARNENAAVFMSKASDWNWKEIQSSSNRLKYYITSKLLIRKFGSNGVLRGADVLSSEGVMLR